MQLKDVKHNKLLIHSIILYWKTFSILVSVGVLLWYISVRNFFFFFFVFFFVFFCFDFFFLLFQIALARKIKDAFQPLKPLGGVHIWINSWSNFRNTEIWTILSCRFFLSDIIVMSSFMFRKMSFYYMDCPPLRAVWMTVFIFFKSVLQHQVGANKAGGS